MNEEQSLSEAEKSQLVTHLQELDQGITQKEGQIRTLEQQLGGATAQQQEPLRAQLSMVQQEHAAMIQNVNVIRDRLGLPAVNPGSAPSS